MEIREVEDNELMDLSDIEQISFKNSYRISTLADMYGKSSYKFLQKSRPRRQNLCHF